jgi:hypothetical protein
VSTQASLPTPDFTQLARRPSERLAVVQHILTTAGLQETDYLEWKAGYDLSTNTGAAATSKHLIGFANRDFGQAARHADGHAYLLIGIEPGKLVGVDVWDSADVENWLVRFTGRELRYDLHYVELTGKHVLFLTIDPPKQGDPIYCLQRASAEPGGKTLPEAAVYVRHGGQTDVASAADIARLTARSRAIVSTLALWVELDTSGLRVMGETVLSDATRNAFVERERASLYATLPQEQGSYPFSFPSSAVMGERRTREEFATEVEAYAAVVTSKWRTLVAVYQVEHEQSKLVPVVVNDTDRNFEDVVVELTLPFSRTWVYTGRYEAESRLRPPERPPGWGKGLLASLAPSPPQPERRAGTGGASRQDCYARPAPSTSRPPSHESSIEHAATCAPADARRNDAACRLARDRPQHLRPARRRRRTHRPWPRTRQ